ncbi:MAG: aspartate kinase [Candidatus Auribacterota bacterium]|jgi:aspartate kinase|uniref:Aspartokinase n=1 Tax=Candidatus Auribacter fodinae TaxID=2093366 RepID=A0A3A4R337_9BACT|nr:MAG: aspartate kinase [Candidatus Auribacter fodinae]
MALIVQKYGGTSVGDPERIMNVAKRVVDTKRDGNQVVVVVSAMGGQTDKLINLAKEISKNPSDRELDMLVSTGEQISVALLAMAIHELGEDAISLTGAQVGIMTDDVHTKARILDIKPDKMQEQLALNKVVIVAGFQGINIQQDITTLGRGGSDTTAVALAAVLKADMCEIYTDVDGVYTADPRIVPNARKLKEITHEEMLEMASLGAKVLMSRSVEFANKYNVPLCVRSSFNRSEGTYIVKETNVMEQPVIRGVTADTSEAKVTLLHLPDQPGIAAKLFNLVAKYNINIDMIIQNVSEHGYTDISFTVNKNDVPKIKSILADLTQEVSARAINVNEDIAKISVVGIGMRSHSGVASKMFNLLAQAGINISMISTSEIKISCVIREGEAKQAVKVLHEGFELDKE